MGVPQCVCCRRRTGRAETSNRWRTQVTVTQVVALHRRTTLRTVMAAVLRTYGVTVAATLLHDRS